MVENVLDGIDSNIIATLQERIPNGSVIEGKNLPNVQFDTITSRFVHVCFTDSDTCKWVKSRLQVNYAGKKPDHSVERVTLALVQDYLNDYFSSDPLVAVRATYAYPLTHSSVGRFQLSPVNGSTMTASQREYFEKTFYDVFNAITFSIDGDTALTDAYFVYQHVTEIIPDYDEGEMININTKQFSVSVDLKYYGKCRYCNEEEFVQIIDGLIETNLEAFQKRLKNGRTSSFDDNHNSNNNNNNNNVDYFQSVEEVTYSLPELPDGLPPIEDVSIFDMKVSTKSTSLPWYLSVGIVISILMIIAGVLVVTRDQQQLKKEGQNTDGESDSSINSSINSNINSSSRSRSNNENSNNSEHNTINDDYIIETSSLADDTIASTKSKASTNMNSNYEVCTIDEA